MDIFSCIFNIAAQTAQISLTRNRCKYIFNPFSAKHLSNGSGYGKMCSKIRVNPIHVRTVSVQIPLSAPFVGIGKMQFKWRGMNKLPAKTFQNNAHFQPLGRTVCIQFQQKVYHLLLLLMRRCILHNNQKVNITALRIKTAKRNRTMNIYSDKVITENFFIPSANFVKNSLMFHGMPTFAISLGSVKLYHIFPFFSALQKGLQALCVLDIRRFECYADTVY